MTFIENPDKRVRPSIWIEDQALKWVAEDETIHRAPTDEDIITLIEDNAVTELGLGDWTSNENGVATANDFCVSLIVANNGKETIEMDNISLVRPTGKAVSTGIDLCLVELTPDSGGGTKVKTLLSGDGDTRYVDMDERTYTNPTQDGKLIAIGVDNGHFNTGSGSSEEVVISFRVSKK